MKYNPNETLIDVWERYELSHQMCHKHRSVMRNRARKFTEFLGKKAKLKDFDANDVNRYLVQVESQGLSPATLRGYRTALMTLLIFARWKIEDREEIRRFKMRWNPPQGWNLAQIRKLLAVAEALQGYMPNGVAKRDFWMTAIHAGYCTGLRWGDLAKLPVDAIGRDGICSLTQNKTGRPVTVRFSPDALAWIKRHGQANVLPWPYTQKCFCQRFAQLVERAEITGGSFRWLRRTAGSYADAENRGDGRKLLGHSSDQIFDRHYNVDAITNKRPVEPTPLTVPKAVKPGKRLAMAAKEPETTYCDWL
jgi:integrase